MFASLFVILFDYQKEILALVLASDVRVNVWRVFALQIAIRALELRLATARDAQMRIQRTLVLVALRALWAHIIPGLHSVDIASLLNREGWVHEAASGQMTFQMSCRRVRTIAETATISANVITVKRRRCNRQRRGLNGRVLQESIFETRSLTTELAGGG